MDLVGNQIYWNFVQANGIGLTSIKDPTPVAFGQWTHYVGVIDLPLTTPNQMNAYLYRNGALVASVNNAAIVPDNGCDWSIGGENEPAHGSCSANAGNYFVGAIDEVEVFNYVLHADDVAALYAWEYDATRAQTSPDPGNQLLLAQKFAPRLRFDDRQIGYPMSAQAYFAQVGIAPPSGTPRPTTQATTQNTDYGHTIPAGQVPTYYAVTRCGNQTRINYWTFYGYQDYCSIAGIGAGGSHNGDWEHVIVTLTEDQSQAAAVTYSFHGDWYTRYPSQSGVYFENTERSPDATATTATQFGSSLGPGPLNAHPVVYISEATHSNRYAETPSGVLSNYSSSCIPHLESAYNEANGYYMDTWRNLVSLVPPASDDGEPWMAWDSSSSPGDWGFPGVSTHPTVSQTPAYRSDGNGACQIQACAYTTFTTFDIDNVRKALFTHTEDNSQCLLNDTNTSVESNDPFGAPNFQALHEV